MTDVIVDTTILIDAANEFPKAVLYLNGLLTAGEAVTHVHAVAELLSGTRDSREQRQLLRMLRDIRIHHPNEHDSQAALEFLKRFHLSNNIGFEDCLIASTALRLSLPVATLNDRHFRLFKGLKVIRPY
jgi:predicted nucleic acid-binding protein